MQEESIFLEVFGDYPINRVMDFLIIYEDFDYPMTEIAAKSGIGYSTLKLFWSDLVRSGIVVQTRTIGNAKLFQLNKKSSIVKQFKKLYWTVIEKVTEETVSSEHSKAIPV